MIVRWMTSLVKHIALMLIGFFCAFAIQGVMFTAFGMQAYSAQDIRMLVGMSFAGAARAAGFDQAADRLSLAPGSESNPALDQCKD